jgi:D-methionine transport system substrate-binding protein
MLKKVLLFVVILFVSVISLSNAANIKIKVGASPVPHAEILKQIKPDLEKDGVDLEIVEIDDYVTPNLSLDDGNLDANYFQHIPYLNEFTKSHKLNNELVSLKPIHVEPIGLYSKKIKNIKELKNGAKIAVPNDPSNEGRSLILLENAGLIKLDKKAGLLATTRNIIENKKKIVFAEIDTAQLPRVIGDFDAVIINGNYALEAGYNPVKDSILLENEKSPYANYVVVRKGDEKRSEIKKLEKHLRSKKVKDFILKQYNGGVVAAF